MPVRWTLENHLPQYAVDIRSACADIVGKGVMDILANTQVATPVRLGQAKAGWQPVMPELAGDGPIVGGVGNNVEHATYLELGTGAAGASSAYPFPRTARYTMSWPGMRARAMLGLAGERVLPAVQQALGRLGARLRQR